MAAPNKRLKGQELARAHAPSCHHLPANCSIPLMLRQQAGAAGLPALPLAQMHTGGSCLDRDFTVSIRSLQNVCTVVRQAMDVLLGHLFDELHFLP